ncbi:hypothetical protein C8R44DRAFT_988271 [Mycena epipterygia]|nr:hypothetical protein C8R44DRAFT_988271 [Mycena epipterygia]
MAANPTVRLSLSTRRFSLTLNLQLIITRNFSSDSRLVKIARIEQAIASLNYTRAAPGGVGLGSQNLWMKARSELRPETGTFKLRPEEDAKTEIACRPDARITGASEVNLAAVMLSQYNKFKTPRENGGWIDRENGWIDYVHRAKTAINPLLAAQCGG